LENPENQENQENQETEKKKPSPLLLWGLFVLALVCVLVVGGSALAYAWNQVAQPARGTPLVDVKGAPAATAAATSVAAQPGTCRRSGQQIILLLGYDTRVEYPFGSDGLRLLRADYANQRMELLALPRGIWVAVPAEVQPALQAASLGELYQYGLDQGGPDVKDARTTAARLVAQALYDNFGLAPDNFVVAEMQAFQQVVDSLGGIDITLPDDTTLNGQVYTAGAQHWDGATTLAFVRALPTPDTDWDRFARQNLVLQAMKDSSSAPSLLTQLPVLLTQLEAGVTTDLSLSGLADVSCLARQMPQGQVQPQSLPEDLVTQGPGVYLIPDVEAMSAYLQGWASGK